MNLKNLLFASGKCLYPIGEGGGETIAHDLLSGLVQAGKPVMACGALALKDVARLNESLRQLSTNLTLATQQQKLTTHGGQTHEFVTELSAAYQIPYLVQMSLYEHFLRDMQKQLQANPPSLLLLQAELSPQLLQQAHAANVPTIFYAQNGLELDQFADPRAISLVLTNSNYFKQRLEQKYQVRCELLYPAINLENYRVANNTHEFITMINPVVVKGIGPFLQLALTMPQRRFLVVEGWGTPPHIQELIGRVPNVTYLPKQLDMRQVYQQTHLLVVPSQWDEAFGRVVVEAQTNGIPVVASAAGGLPEAVGEGGMLVKDYRQSEAFKTAILDAESRYSELSRLAHANALRFTVESSVKRFLEIVDGM